MNDTITRWRGRARKRLLQVLETLAYDLTGLPLALRHLLRLKQPDASLPASEFLHRHYGAASWKWPFGPLRQLIAALLWPLGLAVAVTIFTMRNGKAIRTRANIGLASQVLAQIAVAWKHGLAPFWFYMFELWDPGRRANAHKILTAHETIGPAYDLLQPSQDADRLDDKVKFASRCKDAGIPAVPVLLYASGGHFVTQEDLPKVDLFVKPRTGSGGHRMERWDVLPDGRYRNSKGMDLTAPDLRARIAAQSLSDDFLVQPRLQNHPALDDISNGALATIRLLTIRNEQGRAEAVNAAFRMAIGTNSVVDNFHQGGLAAAVNLETGEIGEASDIGIRPAVGWRTHHPVSGAQFKGRILPFWSEAKALACAAHEAFPERVIVGWDVAMLADGVMIVEGNGRPDLDIHQRAERKPLGEARIADLLKYHVLQRR